jgi:precorrin-6B methylase 2
MGNLTYGEITAKGVIDIIENLKKNNQINENSILFDIGSGYGKIPRMFAEITDIKAVGIEIDEELHDVSVKTNKWTNKTKKIRYINSCFTKCEKHIKTGTIFIVNCIMWDKNLINKLVKILPKNAILIHNKTTIPYDEIIPTWVSWEQRKPSKFYKINTNNLR